MQRNDAPQSVSHRHCAVIGAASVQAPLAQLCPSAQSVVVAHAAWHWPAAHTRPCPQAVSLVAEDDGRACRSVEPPSL